jgi:hypothetical protein
MYQRLLELIKLIFGKSAINKTIGTRTNVIQLPNNKTKRYIKEDLNIEAASDAAAMNAKKEMEELIAEIPKMNDAERLIFEGNLQRLKNRLGLRSETDPTAEVFDLGTKEKVTPGGITSLTEKAGQKSPPGTIMGNLESRIKQLEASGEDLSTMKGQTLDEIMGDVMQTQKTMSKMQDEGLVRAAVRYKMMDDLKRGTLKLPKNLEDVVRGASNEEDVITVFRNNYGEDALEQVDSLIPDFYNMTSPADAVKKIEKNFPNMKPKKIEVKQTMDLDEATKAEQENILTPGKAIPADSPEGKKITEGLIGKPKAEVVSLPTAEKILSDMRNLGPIDAMKEANKVLKREGPYKNLTDKDIEKIMDDINDHIFGGDLPVDPEDFATGGRVGFSGGKLVKKGIEALAKKIKKPKKEVVPDLTSQEKLYDEYIYYRDELGNFKGSFDDFIIARRKAGSLYAEETPLSNEAIKRKLNATGGRVGYADGGSKGLDYLMGVDRKGYADGSLDEFLKSTTLVSPSGKSYNYDFIQSLPGTPQSAAQKFGREAIYGTTVNAGDNDITTPGKYASYYNLADEGSLKQEYSFLKDYILQPENLVRDYGLEGAKKILTPYRQTTTPISTPAEEMKETYTANVTPSNLYPNNPFYSSAAKTLYPNNPFYSPSFGVSTKEDTSKAMSSDISVLYDQYMKNLGYQSGGRVGMAGERRGYANGNIVSGLAIRLNRPVQPGDPIGSYYGGTPIMISNKKVEPTLNRDSQGRLVNSITGQPITTLLPLNRELMSSPSKPSMTLRDKLRPLSLNERLQFFATNKPSYDEFYDLLQMNLKGEDRQQAADGGSQGLDYLMGIERRGYANGDYVVQAGIKNYLGKQKTATVPIKWKSGKGDSHPDTELAYITKPEKDLLIKLDMHNSMPDGEPNIGPGGLISLNSGGDGGAGGGGGGDGGSTDTGDQGSEAANDAASASAAASASGSSGTDTADMGSEAANVSSTSSGAASVGSGSSGTDTADMGSEAANVSSTQSGAASVGAGDSGGPTDTADLGTEAANDAATAAAAASVGMGTLSSYSRPGMVATNISNYMRGNPMTSLGLTALGTMIGVPALGVMNAVNSVYGGGSSGSSTGSGQGGDGSGDGGDEEDERTPISSFDSALLTPDLLDSYNLAKNRDYRLFQSSNNPFYSLQRNPSGGISNVYTEFKKGGRVGFAEGGSMSKGLDYLSGVERRGYVGGGFGSGLVDPMEAMYVNTFGFNPFPKYGFNSYMDYNTARITGTPMNQNISDLEDYLGTLESAREINLPGVTKDLSAEDISRLQEEYVKKMAKTSNALNPTVTASTAASTPDYRQQALSEMLSRYNVSSLGDIKNFNYLIPGYKDKNNLEVRAFETRIPDLAVSRRAQQLEDAAIRAQQDQEAYKNRISQVDPNALRNSYLQNLQNTSSQSIDQFQSKLRSNLVPRKQAAQGLNYLTGL